MPDTPPPLLSGQAPSDEGEHLDAPLPPVATAREKQFPCGQCGGLLVFKPGTTSLNCEYCGHLNDIPQSEADIREIDFELTLRDLESAAPAADITDLKCDSCGALVEKPANIDSMPCPFCGSDIVAVQVSRRLLKPAALLPFALDRKQARDRYKTWLHSLWFAPSKLRKYAELENRFVGMYVPYWTFDAATTSFYTGQRGDDYYVTKTRTVTVNGKRTTQTYREKRTRWTSVSGTVWRSFDDVLVIASQSLPVDRIEKLEPWDLAELKPYDDAFLSGFRTESYTVDLPQGFQIAAGKMDVVIRSDVRSDIGGDHQRIHSLKTQHDDVTFKHILLPLWICAYRFHDKSYRFMVNARTGEVQGERPYSWPKITAAVLTVLAIAAVIAMFAVRS